MKKQTYDILRTSSVRILCELFTKQLQPYVFKELLTPEQYRRWESMRRESEYLAMFYLGLLVSGCRVRELLNVKWSDISVFGQVIISGSKGSSSRAFSIPGYDIILIGFRDRQQNPFFCLSYGYVYRSLIRHGVSQESGTGGRRKIAHSLRYSTVEALMSQTEDVKKVADIIGHRTQKTTEYYLRHGRCKKKVK